MTLPSFACEGELESVEKGVEDRNSRGEEEREGAREKEKEREEANVLHLADFN